MSSWTFSPEYRAVSNLFQVVKLIRLIHDVEEQFEKSKQWTCPCGFVTTGKDCAEVVQNAVDHVGLPFTVKRLPNAQEGDQEQILAEALLKQDDLKAAQKNANLN